MPVKQLKPKKFLAFYTKTYQFGGLEHMDLTKRFDPNKGKEFTFVRPFKWLDLWAFADPMEFPASRWFAISFYVQMATSNPSEGEFENALIKAQRLFRGTPEQQKQCGTLLDTAKLAATLTDVEKKWLNLGTAFLIATDEDPLNYDEKPNEPKIKMFNNLAPIQKANLSNWAMNYFVQILEGLKENYPQAFQDKEVKKTPFLKFIETAQKNEEVQKIFLLQMANEDATKIQKITNLTINQYYDVAETWRKLYELKNPKKE